VQGEEGGVLSGLHIGQGVQAVAAGNGIEDGILVTQVPQKHRDARAVQALGGAVPQEGAAGDGAQAVVHQQRLFRDVRLFVCHHPHIKGFPEGVASLLGPDCVVPFGHKPEGKVARRVGAAKKAGTRDVDIDTSMVRGQGAAAVVHAGKAGYLAGLFKEHISQVQARASGGYHLGQLLGHRADAAGGGKGPAAVLGHDGGDLPAVAYRPHSLAGEVEGVRPGGVQAVKIEGAVCVGVLDHPGQLVGEDVYGSKRDIRVFGAQLDDSPDYAHVVRRLSAVQGERGHRHGAGFAILDRYRLYLHGAAVDGEGSQVAVGQCGGIGTVLGPVHHPAVGAGYADLHRRFKDGTTGWADYRLGRGPCSIGAPRVTAEKPRAGSQYGNQSQHGNQSQQPWLVRKEAMFPGAQGQSGAEQLASGTASLCYTVPMNRYFNTTGPCRPDLHYMLPPAARVWCTRSCTGT
jgi:hypothetical protein